MNAQPKPPVSAVHPVTDVYHGVSVVDPYRWLEEDRSPETRAWIGEQVRYTRSLIDPLPQKAAFRKRLTALMRVETLTAPESRHGRYFYTRRAADATRFSIYVRDGLKGTERKLVDPAEVSRDPNASVSIRVISNDATLLGYALRVGGADEEVVRFIEVATGKVLPVELPLSRYENIDLTPDNATLYYSDLPSAGPRVFKLAFKTKDAKPEQIFGQDYNAEFAIETALSPDGKHLLMNVSKGASGINGEVVIYDTAQGKPSRLVHSLGAETHGIPVNDGFYLYTDWKAPRRRVLKIDYAHPEQAQWKEVVPESSDTLSWVAPIGGKLILHYLHNATSLLRLTDAAGKDQGSIALPPNGSVTGVTGEWGSTEAFLSYSSFISPPRIERYDLKSKTLSEWDKSPVPFDGAAYETKQVWFASKDGTKIPTFITAKRGTEPGTPRPTLMYAYGGFNVNITPSFSAMYAAWLEAGGVLAIPNLRGGGEFGESWHRDGMLGKKQNVFDDYIGAAEWLIAQKYTDPAHLAISGGSNGGLLVAAALTQRPELYKAVLCGVPLIDMLRYQNFLLGRLWVPEYGSSEVKDQFDYIYRYSPYQAVKAGTKYPAVLLYTGDSDTRVAPLHARKMTALLQASTASGLPVALLYDTEAGHSSGLPVTKLIEDTSDRLAFVAWQLGVHP